MKAKIDIEASIPYLLMSLDEPSERDKANVILDEINEKIKSGSIMGLHKKPVVAKKPKKGFQFFCICCYAEEESENSDFDNLLDGVMYIDLRDLLYELVKRDDCQTEFKSLLSNITFDQMSHFDFFNFISVAQNSSQQNLVYVINKYFESGGDLKLVLCFFSSFLDRNFENAIILVMQHRDFKKIFDKVQLSELLGSFHTTEGFIRATELFDFSECDLRFFVIREGVLIEFFKKFPHRLLEMGKIEYYDIRIGNDSWLRGNIYDYAANYNHNNLLRYLITELNDNPSFSREVSSKYIRSVETARLLYNEKFHIKSPENNAYCLDALVTINGEPPEFEITSGIINDSIEYKLVGLIFFIVTHASATRITIKQLQSIIINFAYTNPDVISQTILWLNKQNTAHHFDELIVDIFKLTLSHPGNKYIVLSLLKHHSSLLYQLREGNPLEKIISGIYDPKIITILVKHKFQVPKEKLRQVYVTALVQNDENTITELDKHLVSLDKLDLWKYGSIELPESGMISEDTAKVYGSGIHQEQYRYYQQLMVVNIVSHLLTANFKLLPSEFTIADITTISDDYQPPVPIDFFPLNDDASNNGKVIFSLAEKYQNQCTIFSLGAFRHSISLASQPNNPEADCCFGKYRTRGLETAMFKYHEYFERFLSTQYKNYKNTIYLKCEGPSFSGLPNCTIIGYINNQPIELTKYVEREDGYSWVHTDPKHLPEIVFYCQTLIDNIAQLDIDHRDVIQVEDLSEKISHVHWWLSHACTFERGSASISESICKGLFLRHGLKITWNTMLDCEALISPSEDDYARKYSSFLTIMPLPLKKDAFQQFCEHRLDETNTISLICQGNKL